MRVNARREVEDEVILHRALGDRAIAPPAPAPAAAPPAVERARPRAIHSARCAAAARASSRKRCDGL
jgi:hypothetical protein